MPDWFYRTLSKPILFSLPATRARDFALGFMGTLSRLPLCPYPNRRRFLTLRLLLVLHGFGLLGAGAVISVIGVAQVFVHEDLEFMQTTEAALAAADPRLVLLVAHDRATLGGMLLAAGWLFLLPALWGFRRGSAWLWWSLLIAGVIAYAAAIGVHYAVGYLSGMHLLPAFGGLALTLVGLILSYPFLCRKD